MSGALAGVFYDHHIYGVTDSSLINSIGIRASKLLSRVETHGESIIDAGHCVSDMQNGNKRKRESSDEPEKKRRGQPTLQAQFQRRMQNTPGDAIIMDDQPMENLLLLDYQFRYITYTNKDRLNCVYDFQVY